MIEDRLIAISALQHYLFCPRQCGLIHLEQIWQENFLTAHGRQLHERVDNGDPETRKGIRFERGISVSAPEIGLTGKLDLLEFDIKNKRYCPVEYKRGKPKATDVDKVQLCAQALCIEEMTQTKVEIGALWYWQTRKRLDVPIDNVLRNKTTLLIGKINIMLLNGKTPEPIYGKHCTACSLNEICQPELITNEHSLRYQKALYDLRNDE
ncbi:CRISPR-associated protein Cas4 [Providencia burhodogranariea]|uniref:CRISPR-associated exonuclease Cas4 n=1 Tax=Providencia burhodogranariea DSM 19968 TaxID=1141662 RepID=K8WUI5_9GAMM|nr:CRISPR-associated Cas4 family protein [Providencia burhodogranariea DSM 19968]